MKWTKKQAEAIETQGKSLLVSAAAGSGKTAVLIERIKRMIIEGATDVDKILVVTFTKAAASEMKEKLVVTLHREIESNPENAGLMKAQLDKIYKSSISTFHSFALDIVRKYFYVLDIDPGISICDDVEAKIMQGKAINLVFEDFFESENDEFTDFLRAYSTGRSEAIIKENILSVYAKIQSMPEPFEWMKKSVELLGSDVETFKETKIIDFIKKDTENQISKILEAYTTAGALLEQSGLEKLFGKVEEEIMQIEEIQNADFHNMGKLLQQFKSASLRATKDEKDDYEEIKDTVAAWRKEGKGRIDGLKNLYFAEPLEDQIKNINATSGKGATLLQILEKFHATYREMKAEKNLVDFNDIEHFAIEILKNEEVATECRNRFDYIFIDEYQDSNYLQEEIIGKIKRENNVFMVGDIKQSIYRFRLAEPDIFKERAEDYSNTENKEGEKIDLNLNFRSKKPILDGINSIFESLMDGYDDDAALHLGIDEDGGIVHPIKMIVVDGAKNLSSEEGSLEESIENEELLEMKNHEIEALAAVKTIEAALGENIYDTKKGIVRPLEKRDIVILMRGVKKTAEIFHDALVTHGIDCYIDDNSGYFDALEILTFTDLLRVIDNSRQDIPLISTLRSSVFGFSVDELIEIRLGCKKGSYRDAMALYGKSGDKSDLREKVIAALNSLSKWKRDSRATALDVFVWKLMRETGYYNYIGGLPGGKQRQANLRTLVDKTAAFSEKSQGTIYSLLQYIDAIGDKKIEIGQVKMVSENDDVVKIMTIHKSKGLEFPMVITAGLGKKFNFSTSGKMGALHKDFGYGLSLVNPDEHWKKKTLIENAIITKQKQEELEEEIRVLYVAMTRAKDKLVLLGAVNDLSKKMEVYETGVWKNGCYLDLIYNLTREAGIEIIHENRETLQTYLAEDKNKNYVIKNLFQEHGFDEYLESRNEEYKEIIQDRLSFVYPYEKDESVKSKYSVSQLNSDDKQSFKLNKPLFTIKDKTYTGAEKGTIIHTVMEHLDFSMVTGDDRGNYVEKKIFELVEKQILFQEEADTVDTKKILNFFDSPVGIRAMAAKEIHKESPFNILHELDGTPVMVQGIIDCWFEDEEGICLLDYKTNYTGKGIEDKYRRQIDMYAHALEMITGKKVDQAYLYLFTEDLLIKMI